MAEKTKVTRIKASDTAPQAPKAPRSAKLAKSAKSTPVKAKKTTTSKNPFVRIGGYFKGAWIELKQVRWPTRKATWGLTLAVILFSAFFVVLILLLDALFQYIFKIIVA